MPPPETCERRFSIGRLHSFLSQVRLAHDSGNQRQPICTFRSDAMIEAALTGPLRHAAGQIHFPAADFPTFVTQLDDSSHWTGTNDSPVAFSHLRNSYGFAVHQRSYSANSDRVTNAIDIATER